MRMNEIMGGSNMVRSANNKPLSAESAIDFAKFKMLFGFK